MDPDAIKARVKEQLRKDEGFSAELYKDTEGLWTIGYGRCLSRTKLRVTEAELMLTNDVDCCILDLFRALPWVGTQPDDVIGVLVNMTYNLGIVGLAGFERFLAALQAGDRAEAAKEMMSSLWAFQVGKRAVRLAAIVRGAV